MAELDFNVARSTVTRHLLLAGGDVHTAARVIYLERLCEEEEEGKKQWLAAQRLQREVLIRTCRGVHCACICVCECVCHRVGVCVCVCVCVRV